MIIRSAGELGHLIRARRRTAKLTQEQLATRIGVSRQWLVEMEAGKPTAALSLVLRTLRALGIRVDLLSDDRRRPKASVDIDAIIDAAKSRK